VPPKWAAELNPSICKNKWIGRFFHPVLPPFSIALLFPNVKWLAQEQPTLHQLQANAVQDMANRAVGRNELRRMGP
jgi:hypothetical protein